MRKVFTKKANGFSPIASNARKYRPQSGFALVATIMLMVLLAVLTLGTLSLSVVTLRTTDSTSAQAQARANARMALMLAIGELQMTMGPDKRISARSATLAKHPAFAAPVAVSGAKAWWVGAASSDKTVTIGFNNQPVVWLLSGLSQTTTSANQIAATSPFSKEITMYSGNSIDLNLTGGQPITAGGVSVLDAKGKIAGSYAYFIDDNGMKAQLAASDPKLLNQDSSATRVGGAILPGSYDLSILEGMDGLAGIAVGDYSKLNSINDLPLLGGGIQISKNKRLSYTTQSLGVLSDVKKGGLKKDLTIAFENHEIKPDQARHPDTTAHATKYPNWPVYNCFDSVFKKSFDDSSGQDNNWDEYLVVDESKRSEFGANGYIHWAMFRDYYNLKRYIHRSTNANKGANGTMDWLDPITFHNTALKSATFNILPPHKYGTDGGGSVFRIGAITSGTPDKSQGIPYGNYLTWPNKGVNNKEFMEYYKHSPVGPILSRLQVNTWLKQGVKSDPINPAIVDAIQTNAQAFLSFYNPFNIGMRYQDPGGERSFASDGFPVTSFYFPNTSNEMDFFSVHKRTYQDSSSNWFSVMAQQKGEDNSYRTQEAPVFVSPGRAITVAVVENVMSGGPTSKAFSYKFTDLIDKSMYFNYDLKKTIPSTLNFDVHVMANSILNIGVMQQDTNGGYLVSQRHLDAFARKPVKMADWRDSPGIVIDVPITGIGPNSRASFSYRLRSTNEPDSNSIRPLVDANIRGFFVNPRWDSPLGLDTSAAYIIDDDPNMDQVPQMLPATDGEGSPIGFTYWGAADYPPDGYDRVILFDIPRQDLVSLGQLQHANAGRFSYEPSYIVGNSYANPRIKKDSWKDSSITDTYATTARGFDTTTQKIPGSFTLYDASYLVNETLWDSYIFTTIPQFADDWNGTNNATPVAENDPALFTALLKREKLLPNPRFIPYQPAGSSFNAATLQEPGSNAIQSAFHHNSGHLLVDGSFNVNSTSVDAWEAFLSGTYGMPFQKLDVNGQVTGYEMPSDPLVRYPRVQSIFGDAMETDSPDDNYWIGFPALKQTEVRELADEIVNQIKERGPFLTLGDFVNRKLTNGELGEKGALQAALDKTVNDSSNSYSESAKHPKIPTGETQAAGFPGQLLQGDLLQALSPCMTVRSDTFTIRAYGESINPVNGNVIAKAWCQAVVQRYPDPVSPDPSLPLVNELAQPSSKSGRVFRVTSFRWLNEKEI